MAGNEQDVIVRFFAEVVPGHKSPEQFVNEVSDVIDKKRQELLLSLGQLKPGETSLAEAEKKFEQARAVVSDLQRTGTAGGSRTLPKGEREGVAQPLSRVIDREQQRFLEGTGAGTAQDRLTAARAEAAASQALAAEASELGALYAQAQVAQAAVNAETQENLATTSGYSESLARAKIAQEFVNAEVQEHLARSEDYKSSLARAKSAQELVNAEVTEKLSVDSQYKDALVRGKVAQEVINAEVTERLSQDELYKTALATGKIAQERLNADVLQMVAVEDSYITALADGRSAQARINASVQQRLVGDSSYAQSLVDGKVAQQRINNKVNARLLTDSEYLSATVAGKTLQLQLNNAIQRRQLTDSQYTAAVVESKTLQEVQNNKIKRRTLGDTAYLASVTQGKVLQEQINAATKSRLVNDTAYTAALVQGKVSQERLNATVNSQVQAQLANNQAVIEAKGTEAASRKLLTERIQAETLASTEHTEAIRLQTANRIRQTQIQSAANLGALNAVGAEGIVNRHRVMSTQLDKGIIAARDALQKQVRNVAELEEQLGLRNRLTFTLRSEIENAIKGENLQDVSNRLEVEKIRLQRIRNANIGVQTQFAAQGPSSQVRPGGGPPGAGRGGQLGFFSGGFRSVARFGITSALLFGAFRGISDAVREAKELEQAFIRVRSLMNASFGSDADRQFEIFRRGVFEIAETTGIAADEIAEVGFQFQAVFGNDTQRTIEETRSAMIGVVITGLEMAEVVDSFTAITQSFSNDEFTLGVDQMLDDAIALEEEFGVLSGKIIQFTADLAPVGAELGFTNEELQSLGAAALKFSGKSLGALTDGFGRVLPQIQENAVDIVNIFSRLGADVEQQLFDAFGRGEVGDAFKIILREFDQLTQVERTNLAEQLGGRREFQSIIGVLRNGDEVVQALDRDVDSAGKALERFAAQQESVAIRTQIVGEEFRRVFQELFDAGLRELFLDLIDAASGLVAALGLVADAVGVIATVASQPGINEFLQTLLLLQGGRLLVGGVRSLARFAGRRGAATATTTATGLGGEIAAGATARRGATAARGGLVARLGKLTTAITGLNPAIGGLTLALGSVALGVNSISSANQRAAEAAGLRVTAGGISDEEIREIVGLERGEVREKLLQELRAGTDISDLPEELRKISEKQFSGTEEFLDRLPGDLSKKVAVQEAELEALADGILSNINEFFDAFDAIDTDVREAKALDKAKEIFENFDPSEAIADQFAQTSAEAFDRAFDEETRLSIQEQQTPAFEEKFKNQAQEVQARFQERVKEGEAIAEPLFDALREEFEGKRGAQSVISLLEQGLGELTQSFKETDKRLADARAATQEASQSVEEVEALVDLGVLSNEDLTEALRGELRALERFHAAGEGGPSLAEVLRARGKVAESIIAQLDEDISELERQENLTGVDQSEAKLAVLEDALDDPALSIEQSGKIVERIVEVERERAQTLADLAETEAEKTAILAGNVELSQKAEAAYVAQLVADSETLKTFVASRPDLNLEDVVDSIVENFQTTENSLDESIAVVLGSIRDTDQRITNYNRTMESVSGVVKSIAGLTAETADETKTIAEIIADTMLELELAANEAFGEFEGALDAITFVTNLAAWIRRQAEIAADQVGVGGGHPTGRNERAERREEPPSDEDVQSEVGDPRPIPIDTGGGAGGAGGGAGGGEDAEDIAREIEEAKLEVLLAQLEEDPLAAAQIARQQADIAFRFAENEAEQLQAQADAIRADREIQDALFDISNSETELLIARAEASGDIVEAAELGLQQAKDLLKQRREQGAGEAEINRLKGDVASEQANLRDTRLQAEREEKKFLLEIGEISKQQFLSYLQGLLNQKEILELTDKQIRDITLEIKRLKDSVGEDFRFNLPDQILPTVHTARRLRDAGGSVSGGTLGSIVDNRQIEVTVQVQTDASPEDIANAVADVVGDSSRSGTRDRRI